MSVTTDVTVTPHNQWSSILHPVILKHLCSSHGYVIAARGWIQHITQILKHKPNCHLNLAQIWT